MRIQQYTMSIITWVAVGATRHMTWHCLPAKKNVNLGNNLPGHSPWGRPTRSARSLLQMPEAGNSESTQVYEYNINMFITIFTSLQYQYTMFIEICQKMFLKGVSLNYNSTYFSSRDNSPMLQESGHPGLEHRSTLMSWDLKTPWKRTQWCKVSPRNG